MKSTNLLPEPPGQHAVEAVESLARRLGYETAPEVLKLSASVALVRGSKGYYSVHRPDGGYWQCTCRAAQFGKRCKHLKAFSESEKPSRRSISSGNARSQKAPMDSLDAITRQGIQEEESILKARPPFRPTLEAAEVA